MHLKYLSKGNRIMKTKQISLTLLLVFSILLAVYSPAFSRTLQVNPTTTLDEFVITAVYPHFDSSNIQAFQLNQQAALAGNRLQLTELSGDSKPGPPGGSSASRCSMSVPSARISVSKFPSQTAPSAARMGWSSPSRPNLLGLAQSEAGWAMGASLTAWVSSSIPTRMILSIRTATTSGWISTGV